MDFLRAKKTPKGKASISLPKNITLEIIDSITNENNESLKEFLDFIFNNVSSEKLKTQKTLSNTNISRAIKTDIRIELSQWDSKDLQEIKRKGLKSLFPVELQVDNDNNMNNFDNIEKIKTKDKVKKKKK